MQTNSAGEYSAPSLDPGIYTVTAEALGFKKAMSTPISLEVSREVRVDLKLPPGAINETMEVTADGALADTTDTTLNGVLSNKAINELPLQGRDFQNLLPLHPGVQRTPGGGFHSVTSNGNRPDDNNFYIDGADDNDAYYGETVVNDAGISGTPASFLPLDSIQEFNTQEGPGADYGVKPGVVVNMGIKSGTNQIHGTAYYFARNSAVDARNYFDPAPEPGFGIDSASVWGVDRRPHQEGQVVLFRELRRHSRQGGKSRSDRQPGDGFARQPVGQHRKFRRQSEFGYLQPSRCDCILQ